MVRASREGATAQARLVADRPGADINLNRVMRLLLTLLVVVIALDLLADLVVATGVTFPLDGLFVRTVDADSETSTATWLNVLLLMLAAGLAATSFAAHRRLHRRGALGWLGVALALGAASIDEIVQGHESLNHVGERLDPTGSLQWPWVILGVIVVLGLAVVFAPFLLKLPARVRLWLVVGAAMYVAGAIGMELVSGPFYPGADGFSVVYSLLNVLEETLEMGGVIAVIHGCLIQLGLLGGVRLHLSTDSSS